MYFFLFLLKKSVKAHEPPWNSIFYFLFLFRLLSSLSFFFPFSSFFLFLLHLFSPLYPSPFLLHIFNLLLLLPFLFLTSIYLFFQILSYLPPASPSLVIRSLPFLFLSSLSISSFLTFPPSFSFSPSIFLPTPPQFPFRFSLSSSSSCSSFYLNPPSFLLLFVSS